MILETAFMNCNLFYELPDSSNVDKALAKFLKINLAYCFSLICSEAVRNFFFYLAKAEAISFKYGNSYFPNQQYFLMMLLRPVRQIPVINLASSCLKLRSLFRHSDR
jgi:hypothetical protein